MGDDVKTVNVFFPCGSSACIEEPSLIVRRISNSFNPNTKPVTFLFAVTHSLARSLTPWLYLNLNDMLSHTTAPCLKFSVVNVLCLQTAKALARLCVIIIIMITSLFSEDYILHTGTYLTYGHLNIKSLKHIYKLYT